MSEIEMKIKDEIKDVKEMCEKMTSCIKSEFAKGIEHIDTEEMYKAVDILKDLSEIKKNTVKAMYDEYILKAMEESEYGEDYNEDGPLRYYSGQPRDNRGRYMRRRYTEPKMTPDRYYDMYDAEGMRDMDWNKGKRYYTPMTPKHDEHEGKSGMSRKKFIEAKHTHPGDTPNETQTKMSALEEFLNDMAADMTELVSDMTLTEKSMVRQKMDALRNKI